MNIFFACLLNVTHSTANFNYDAVNIVAFASSVLQTICFMSKYMEAVVQIKYAFCAALVPTRSTTTGHLMSTGNYGFTCG